MNNLSQPASPSIQNKVSFSVQFHVNPHSRPETMAPFPSFVFARKPFGICHAPISVTRQPASACALSSRTVPPIEIQIRRKSVPGGFDLLNADSQPGWTLRIPSFQSIVVAVIAQNYTSNDDSTARSFTCSLLRDPDRNRVDEGIKSGRKGVPKIGPETVRDRIASASPFCHDEVNPGEWKFGEICGGPTLRLTGGYL